MALENFRRRSGIWILYSGVRFAQAGGLITLLPAIIGGVLLNALIKITEGIYDILPKFIQTFLRLPTILLAIPAILTAAAIALFVLASILVAVIVAVCTGIVGLLVGFVTSPLGALIVGAVEASKKEKAIRQLPQQLEVMKDTAVTETIVAKLDSGENINLASSCSCCLEDFEAGEKVALEICLGEKKIAFSVHEECYEGYITSQLQVDAEKRTGFCQLGFNQFNIVRLTLTETHLQNCEESAPAPVPVPVVNKPSDPSPSAFRRVLDPMLRNVPMLGTVGIFQQAGGQQDNDERTLYGKR